MQQATVKLTAIYLLTMLSSKILACPLAVLPTRSDDWRDGEYLEEVYLEALEQKSYQPYITRYYSSYNATLETRTRCYSTFIGHTCQMTMTITSPSGIVLSQAKSDPVLSGLGGIDISQTIRRLKNCD